MVTRKNAIDSIRQHLAIHRLHSTAHEDEVDSRLRFLIILALESME